MFRKSLSCAINNISMRQFCNNKATLIGKETPYSISNEGDNGTSKMLSGKIVKKSDPLVHCMGEAEELNAHIGMARSYARSKNHPYVGYLKRTQTILIDLAHHISKSPNAECELAKHTKEMESWIEDYANEVSVVEEDSYLVPGGSEAGAYLLVARAVCRRTERCAVKLVEEKLIDQDCIAYLNRLGDLLLILSRIASKLDKRSELLYIPPKLDLKKNKN